MKVIAIVGPTGVGKTKLSIELAKKFNGEIINGDSTQVYRDLNIATAKIKESEKENIPHHLFDIKNIEEDYTVFNYQTDCRSKISEIIRNNKTPIIVGGTGLYIKAALYDYNFNYENQHGDYSNLSNEELYQKLLLIDPASDIHMNNRKRIIRALDYYEQNKEPISCKQKASKLLYDCLFIGLTTPRDNLYNIINNRVDKMVDEGLIEEAKQIYDSGIRSKAVLTPIGYKELFDYFDNKKDLNECLDLIKQRSRNYAKKQYTWFNNQMNITWFNTNYDDFNETILKVSEYIEKNK